MIEILGSFISKRGKSRRRNTLNCNIWTASLFKLGKGKIAKSLFRKVICSGSEEGTKIIAGIFTFLFFVALNSL